MTKEELIKRWKSPAGLEIRAKVIALLQTAEDRCKKIDEAVASLPGSGEVDPRRQDLRGIELARLDLRGAHLVASCFDYANLEGCNLESTMMHYCILREASLCGARASKAMMTCIIAHKAEFDGADLSGVDLQGADLREASFRNANLEEIVLINGLVDRADFRGASLARAETAGTSFANAILEEPIPLV